MPLIAFGPLGKGPSGFFVQVLSDHAARRSKIAEGRRVALEDNSSRNFIDE